MSRVAYRVGQFLRALRAHPSPGSSQHASEFLPPRLLHLFDKMPLIDQSHGLRVLGQLQRQGVDDPDLLAAALLHDVGKSRLPIAPWERVWGWFIRKLLPHRSALWAEGEAKGLRKAVVVAENHPRWGAQMVREERGSPRLVEFIRYHHEPEGAPMSDIREGLLILRVADDWN